MFSEGLPDRRSTTAGNRHLAAPSEMPDGDTLRMHRIADQIARKDWALRESKHHQGVKPIPNEPHS